jgi:hypothetical protein
VRGEGEDSASPRDCIIRTAPFFPSPLTPERRSRGLHTLEPGG